MSAIAGIEVIPIRLPASGEGDLDGLLDTLLVKVHDEAGRMGFGETDAPPEAGKAFIEMPTAHLWSRNMAAILVGQDPLEAAALWQRLYEGTFWPGRRGFAIHLIGALDLALHDLAGKQLGVPAYKLLGGARRESLRPYCTIWPGMPRGRSIREVMAEIGRQFERALAAGFTAVKMEVLFGDLADDRELVALIEEGRRMLGPDILMALDFGYRWQHWADARRVLDRLDACEIHFAEACLQHDDLDGHARLSDVSRIRICGAEAAATRWEIREWVEHGRVAVVQPNIARSGGFTELRRMADYCELHGVELIPHGWKTGITAAAGRHGQAACPAIPLFEYVSPLVFDSVLRRELTSPEPVITAGRMKLPIGPGLGIELNEELVARYRVGQPTR